MSIQIITFWDKYLSLTDKHINPALTLLNISSYYKVYILCGELPSLGQKSLYNASNNILLK